MLNPAKQGKVRLQMAALSVAGLHEYCFPHSENGLLKFKLHYKKLNHFYSLRMGHRLHLRYQKQCDIYTKRNTFN